MLIKMQTNGKNSCDWLLTLDKYTTDGAIKKA